MIATLDVSEKIFKRNVGKMRKQQCIHPRCTSAIEGNGLCQTHRNEFNYRFRKIKLRLGARAANNWKRAQILKGLAIGPGQMKIYKTAMEA